MVVLGIDLHSLLPLQSSQTFPFKAIGVPHLYRRIHIPRHFPLFSSGLTLLSFVLGLLASFDLLVGDFNGMPVSLNDPLFELYQSSLTGHVIQIAVSNRSP